MATSLRAYGPGAFGGRAWAAASMAWVIAMAESSVCVCRAAGGGVGVSSAAGAGVAAAAAVVAAAKAYRATEPAELVSAGSRRARSDRPGLR